MPCERLRGQVSGRPGYPANVVAFQFPVGRFAMSACCATFLRLLAPLWATVVERYAGAGWLWEADGDVADGRVGDFTPVLCAPSFVPYATIAIV